MNNDNADLASLIERSSFGTEGTRLLRQRAPKKSVEAVVAAAHDRWQRDLGGLVDAAVAGDPDARQAVLRWIRPLVVRYCRARVRDQPEQSLWADEIAEDVCLAVLTALPSYRDHGRPFIAFVYGIAAYKVAEAHRSAVRRNRAARKRGERGPKIPSISGTSHSSAEQPEQRRVTELTEEEVLVLMLLGFSIEEIAARGGSDPRAFWVEQQRALNRLRPELSRGNPPDQPVRRRVRWETHPDESTTSERYVTGPSSELPLR